MARHQGRLSLICSSLLALLLTVSIGCGNASDEATPNQNTEIASTAATATLSTDDQPPAPAGFPPELVGLWESIDSGNATDAIKFLDTGRFIRAQILTQPRESGVFEFDVASAGTVRVSGQELVLTPETRTGKLSDPDAPSENWERPLELTEERLGWSVTGSGRQRELRLSPEGYGETRYKLTEL